MFGYYRHWYKSGFWKHCWNKLLDKDRHCLDLSRGSLDGGRTHSLHGGKEVDYYTHSTNAFRDYLWQCHCQ